MDARADLTLILIASEQLAEDKKYPLHQWHADLNSKFPFRSVQLLVVDESKEPSVPIVPDAAKHGEHQDKLPLYCHSLVEAVNLAVHETLVFVDSALPLNPEANFPTEQLVSDCKGSR